MFSLFARKKPDPAAPKANSISGNDVFMPIRRIGARWYEEYDVIDMCPECGLPRTFPHPLRVLGEGWIYEHISRPGEHETIFRRTNITAGYNRMGPGAGI